MATIDPGASDWLFVCSALVLLMAPALALFYGGLYGRRSGGSATSILVRWVVAIPILSVQWVLFGYSLAFGPTRHGLIGGLAYAGLTSVATDVRGAVPAIAFAACRMMFAVIAPALISGALGARMKLSAYVAFVLFWSTAVYDPVAHWLWGHGGWLSRIGALDFAGGIVVHSTAGISAVVCALVVAKRSGPSDRSLLARDVFAALAGAAVLWFGWFALNAGSAIASGSVLGLSFLGTQLGAAGGGLGWLFVEWSHRGRPTAVGVATGVVSGLVATTPAAGYVAPSAAVAIGFIAGAIGYGTGLGVISGLIAGLLAITAAAGHVEPAMAIAIACMAGFICHAAVVLKRRLGFSSSPEPFGVQGVGGLAGALLTGVFAQKALNHAGADGALFGNVSQLVIQAVACLATAAYAAIATYLILKIIDATIGLSAPEIPEASDIVSAVGVPAGLDIDVGNTNEIVTASATSAPAVEPPVAAA
jgi:ammonium transporter, Amt family